MGLPIYLPTIRQRPDDRRREAQQNGMRKDHVMTRILIATIALAGVAGYAAAQEAPTFESTYSAKVDDQGAEKKGGFWDFFGSRGMGGAEVAQPIRDEDYSGK